MGLIGGIGGAAIFLGVYKHKIDNLEKTVDSLEKEVKQTSHDLTEVSTKLDERTISYSSRLTKRKSPISLSDIGEELLKKSHADQFILEYKDELVQKIREMNPKTAYDVQVDAKKVVESLQNDEQIIPFKDFAFKEGIDLGDVFIVMGIELRDVALPLLGFKVDDIDKHDPEYKQKK